MRKAPLTLALLAFAAAAAPVAAAPLVISNITGSWQNGVPPSNVDVNINAAAQGVDIVRWGGSVSTGSGYNFDPTDNAAVPTPIVLNTPFLLGNFTHFNRPIAGGSSITSIQYSLSLDTNGVPNSLNDTFNFAHNETPNTQPCVAFSVTPCADIVTVTSVSLNQNINVDGEIYYFNLLGFSEDGGASFDSQFISQEEGENSAGLYATVSATPVPEPTSMLLLGTGLGLVAQRLRRRRRA